MIRWLSLPVPSPGLNLTPHPLILSAGWACLPDRKLSNGISFSQLWPVPGWLTRYTPLIVTVDPLLWLREYLLLSPVSFSYRLHVTSQWQCPLIHSALKQVKSSQFIFSIFLGVTKRKEKKKPTQKPCTGKLEVAISQQNKDCYTQNKPKQSKWRKDWECTSG